MEGTRHRRDKGIDLEHQVLNGGESAGEPARGCLVEVIDERPFRAKAKRRKAYAAGELARSSEARNPSVAACVVATGWPLSLSVLPREICWAP